MTQAQERRPGRATEAAKQEATNPTLKGNSTDADMVARATRHGYALRVVTTTANGRFLTHLYASLPSAERALARAAKRGQSGVMHLVRVIPTSTAPADLDEVSALLARGGEGR